MSLASVCRFRSFSRAVRDLRASVFIRSMAEGDGFRETHLEKTQTILREEVIASATVVNLCQLSETVRGLSLKIDDSRFQFKAGQWVDFFIPKVPEVGGFTICSSPRTLQEERVVDLAVKGSPHPPAHWVHTQCKVGDTVQLRAGGDFFYDPQSGAGKNMLLIAGGVGINPLYSIIQHAKDLFTTKHNQSTGRIILLYSASTVDELLFREALIKISKEFPDLLSCKFFVTRETVCNSNIEGHRINDASLEEAVSSLNRQELVSYICGPSPMIRYVDSAMKKLGISEDRINYEKWW